MYYLAIVDSGNYAYKLCDILNNKGYNVEVVQTPCKLAKSGCSYCIKLSPQYKDIVIKEGIKENIYIREIYKVIPSKDKNIYEKTQ